jgi:hypothetical protein
MFLVAHMAQTYYSSSRAVVGRIEIAPGPERQTPPRAPWNLFTLQTDRGGT